MRTKRMILAAATAVLCLVAQVEADVVEVDSLEALAEAAAKSGQTIRMKPGVYKVADYLTDDVLAAIKAEVPADAPGRPPVWMLRFNGDGNRFDLAGVTIEIDTALYAKLPRPGPRGYTRCVFVSGSRNTITGLTIRNSGDPGRGSNGNILSVWGQGNTLEDVSLYVSGSAPYGYGDILGKGGPNLVGLQKQSGIMIAGRDQVLRRCRVVSRAFGHCFYIQRAPSAPPGVDPTTDNVRLEDCYAEGAMRPTSDMLRDVDGPLANLNYRTVNENRDGRRLLVPGYMKALGEDGFRTYGGTKRVTLVNCTAINTRAGFEVNGPDDAADGRTVVDGGTALGCERAYLIGSNADVRRSRGDTKYGPLLYLRGGANSIVELELVGPGTDFTVHALATIAGENHRVRLYTQERANRLPPRVPILLGFGMPSDAEMIAPIKPAAAKNVTLVNELPGFAVVRGEQASDCTVQSVGPVFDDAETRQLANRKPATTTAATTRAAQ